MDEKSKMEIGNLKSEIETLKVLSVISTMRSVATIEVVRRLLMANPNAVHVDELENSLNEKYATTTPHRDVGHRREDIHKFLLDIGLIH